MGLKKKNSFLLENSEVVMGEIRHLEFALNSPMVREMERTKGLDLLIIRLNHD